jgi:phospholipid/cholesterol/gamma-HCH transport system permease protein
MEAQESERMSLARTVPGPVHLGGEVCLDRPSARTLHVRFTGAWRLHQRLPSADGIEQALAQSPEVRGIVLDARGVTDWDTALVSFVLRLLRFSEQRGITIDRDGLPHGLNRLIALATAVPEKALATPGGQISWLARLGLAAVAGGDSALAFLRFLGDATLALVRFARGRANFRWIDLAGILQACGPSALPIVSLISFLVGLILAFMGAVQLQSFGAQVYVADLVAIATTREMGCLMTGVIMAGRTGAAFAAQLGTMRVNEEIDALQTMGIPPMDFLVLPRLLALILMMPLLTIYADVLAILGGAVVGLTALDVGAAQYLERTLQALALRDIAIGIVKGTVFGVLVALSGCLRGMQAGRSAAAVGLAATSAVVTAIVLIVVVEGLFAVVLNALGL